MQILIRNSAQVPPKYLKMLKWKLNHLAKKFKKLIYAEAFIKSEGKKPVEYNLKVRLGIPGPDLIISKKSSKVKDLIHEIDRIAHFRLSKKKLKET